MLPDGLAEDKDLKFVLKELRKAAGRKKSVSLSVSHYLNSPELRRKVFDKALMEETFSQRIVIKYNEPITTNSPGLLKRKRKSEDLDDSNCDRDKKRIRWGEIMNVSLYSTQCIINISGGVPWKIPSLAAKKRKDPFLKITMTANLPLELILKKTL